MRIRFKSNLGSIDAKRLGLDFIKCTARTEMDVPDDVGQKLCEFIAEEVIVEGVAKPAAIKAVPPEEGTVEKATADLKAYREKHTKHK